MNELDILKQENEKLRKELKKACDERDFYKLKLNDLQEKHSQFNSAPKMFRKEERNPNAPVFTDEERAKILESGTDNNA